MKFYMHCNIQLYNEAAKIIELTTWADSYKKQTLNNVSHELECGRIIRTKYGGHTVPFRINDVKGIVDIVSDRDDFNMGQF